MPYRMRSDFLTSAEAAFYRALKETVDGHVVVCPKVSLADLFFVTARQDRSSYHARIASKRVDFVLCDAETLRPIAAVELDDPSHGRPDRAARDAFVQDLFDEAGLPLLHLGAKRGYTREEVIELLVRVYRQPNGAEDPAPAPVDDQPLVADFSALPPPTCLICGVPMELRTARRGRKKGHLYYRCSNYPECREIVRLRDLGISQPMS